MYVPHLETINLIEHIPGELVRAEVSSLLGQSVEDGKLGDALRVVLDQLVQ